MLDGGAEVQTEVDAEFSAPEEALCCKRERVAYAVDGDSLCGGMELSRGRADGEPISSSKRPRKGLRRGDVTGDSD